VINSRQFLSSAITAAAGDCWYQLLPPASLIKENWSM
jgi:hypothetical protein